MPLAEKGVRGKGRQPLSPPQHTEALERECVPSTRRCAKLAFQWKPLTSICLAYG
jgi:hypothetical protein